MRILVVFSHPKRDSFAGAALERAMRALEARGHSLQLIDLYAEDFSPALSAEDWKAYEAVGSNAGGVRAHAEALKAAEAILLVYPSWWYGLPAMLKGWFDRVWLPGVGFELDEKRRFLPGPLTHITRLMVVTTYGSPEWWIRLGVGDPGRKTVMRGLKALLSPACKGRWLALYRMDRNSAAERARFLDRVEREMRFFG
jgi:putative NADPH-quinone reductase